jgi:D-aspartate ligase
MTSGENPFDTSTPAVVLKLTPNVMHHGVLGVTRSLGRIGVPVFGVHEGPLAPVASSRYLAGRFFWRAAPNDVDNVTEGLLRLAERIGRPAVLLTTDDAGALFLAEHGNELRRWFLFPDPPPDLPRKLASKPSLHQLCGELGIRSPQACVPDSLATAREFARAAGYPLIVKLTNPWIAASPLPSTSIVRHQQALDEMYKLREQFGAELMLQEFIPGGPGHDWFFHGYCDAASVCRPAFTGTKARSFPVGAGGTTFGRSVANEKLRDDVTALLARIGYRGVLDIDLRIDSRDGQYNLLDFNPRFGAQFRLFRDTAGIDVAIAAYLDLTGQAIPAGEQVDERTFMVESADLLSVLAGPRRWNHGLKSWVSSLRAVDEPAWFARDDLRPFGLMCCRMAWKVASRPFTAGRSHTSQVAVRASSVRYRAGRGASGAGQAQTAQSAEPEPQMEGTSL